MNKNNQITREQIMKLIYHKNCNCKICQNNGDLLLQYLRQETKCEIITFDNYGHWLKLKGINPFESNDSFLSNSLSPKG
jgi:uncharacterized pyridoxamine 5'-phosphate oxidase family protein